VDAPTVVYIYSFIFRHQLIILACDYFKI
jgi:hypothetical protein